MWLTSHGWKVRQIAGRRTWYKGRAGSELVARHMAEAEHLEYTLQRCRAPSLFMWGLEVAEILGAQPPEPVVKPRRRAKVAAALDALDSFTGTTAMDQAIFATASAPARKLLEAML